MVNHVEACFPTPSVDYLPSLYVQDQKPYRDWSAPRFRSMVTARPSTAGSLRAGDLSALNRSPVALGRAESIQLDHDSTGRAALEAELANPRRRMVTLVWNSEDVIDVHASLFRDGEPFDPMEMPRNLLGCMHVDEVLDGEAVVGGST